MSRNPYLAASRPSSSYTRSSRSSTRPSSTAGNLLGRSRSSATLDSLASQASYASLNPYVPQWQRSLSSTRSGNSALSTGRSSLEHSSSYKPTTSDDWQSSRSLNNSRTTTLQPTNLLKSTSSHNLGDGNDQITSVDIQFI